MKTAKPHLSSNYERIHQHISTWSGVPLLFSIVSSKANESDKIAISSSSLMTGARDKVDTILCCRICHCDQSQHARATLLVNAAAFDGHYRISTSYVGEKQWKRPRNNASTRAMHSRSLRVPLLSVSNILKYL